MRFSVAFVLILMSFFADIETCKAQNQVESILDKADLIYAENPAESFALCERAEREAKSTGDFNHSGAISLCKARYYLLIAKYDAASKEINNAILFFEAKQDTFSLCNALSLKNILLTKIDRQEEAHSILLKVIALERQLNDPEYLISDLLNLSLDYKRMNMPDSMLYVLKQLESWEDKFHPSTYLYYYQNWGLYYAMIGDYKRAIQQHKLAVEISEDQKMTDSKASNLASLAAAYRKIGEIEKAEKFAKLAYEFSEENNLIFESNEALAEWIKIKETKGDYKGAYEVQQKWIRVDKKINDLERIQKVEAMESQLELVQKEKQIAEAEIEIQKSNLEAQKTRTKNAWLIGGMFAVLILLFLTAYIYVKTRKLKNTIQKQKDVVELKSLKLESALENIQHSLEYSQLIQSTLLPSEDELRAVLGEMFVLYLPKDIVSGDFYWLYENYGKKIFAVGDCTGHGVPGAMVSMVCHEALNKVIIEQNILEPAEALNKVRDIVSKTFVGSNQDLNDGMDIALCVLEGNYLKYAGAYNAAWIIRDNSLKLPKVEGEARVIEFEDTNLIELTADKQPIGKFFKSASFRQKSVELISGDSLYLFSDGYADQFGGDKGKKLKATNFKKILANAQGLSMSDQKTHLQNIFAEWKGEIEQLDDVCVIGVRI